MNPEPENDASYPLAPLRIPYSRQSIDDDDIAAVVEVLKSPYLTTGPMVARFEEEVAEFVDAGHGVAVSNGTAALHAAMRALDIGPGDEVILPCLTFVATANAVVYERAKPVFADIEPDTLLVDVDMLESLITPRTQAIVAVDYAGQPCDYPRLQAIAEKHGLPLVADASHSLGATLHGRPVGSLATISTFSFHPVKPITAAEGGMAMTSDPYLAERMRIFRNHGITTDHRQREVAGSWLYEMVELGYNYRMNDMQAALGCSQLKKLPQWVVRRQQIAARYHQAFAAMDGIDPVAVRPGVGHAYHLFVIRLDMRKLGVDRAIAFEALRGAGLGVNVHYIPVHLHPYYQFRLGTGPGLCPVAEEAYHSILSIPLFPSMTDSDVEKTIDIIAQHYEAWTQGIMFPAARKRAA